MCDQTFKGTLSCVTRPKLEDGRLKSRAFRAPADRKIPNALTGQETKHVKIGHVKIDRAHLRVHCREHWRISREHWKISREHSRGSLRGDPLVRFAQKNLNLRWHFRGHLRVHFRVHFREHFRERVLGRS